MTRDTNRLFSVISSPFFNSRIRSEAVQPSERLIGYFLGPAGVILLNAVLASYLNIFYTDVLKLGSIGNGLFLMLFPILAKGIDALTNVVMGQIIDRTHTAQGKARPWLLAGAPIAAVAAVLCFAIPNASTPVQLVWIVFSFNLYHAVGYTMYNMSHNMMVPLSTRNAKQRDGLALLSNMATAMIPGMIVALLFPMLIIPAIGVEQTRWVKMIVVFSIVAMPCVLLEYYFTRERITEAGVQMDSKSEVYSLKSQMKACFSSKYWVLMMIALTVIHICTNVQNISMIYYCNWVLGTYNDGLTQTLVSAIGNAPLGFGIAIMWPLVKKFGKRTVMLSGLVIAISASVGFMMKSTDMVMALSMLAVRAFGVLPITYMTMAMLADALDHVEWKAGFRADGFSMSVYSIILTMSGGLAQGAFNLGLSIFGYVPPAADGSWIPQSSAVQRYFVFSYQGLFTLGMVVLLVVFWFFRVEKEMPVIQADIIARKGIEEIS